MKNNHATLMHLQTLLRYSIAFIWLYTGIVSLAFARSEGYLLLQQASLTNSWQPILVYGGAAIDLLIGLMVFFNIKINVVAGIQIFFIVVYTLIASILIPSYWLHPLAPLAKNIPICAAIWAIVILNRVNHAI